MKQSVFIDRTCRRLAYRLDLNLEYVYFLITSWTNGYTEEIALCRDVLGGEKISECLLTWEDIIEGKDIKVQMPNDKRRNDDREKEATGSCEGIHIRPARG